MKIFQRMRDTATSVIDNSTVGTKKKTLYPSQNRSRHPPRTEAFPLRKAFLLSPHALPQHNLAHSLNKWNLCWARFQKLHSHACWYLHIRKKKNNRVFSPLFASTHARTLFVYICVPIAVWCACDSFTRFHSQQVDVRQLTAHINIYIYVHMCVLHRF